MKTNTQLCALVLTGLFPFADRLSGQAVQTISHGQKVNLSQSLARGKHTVIEFYSDW